MAKFKVGDRVRHTCGVVGTVTEPGNIWLTVKVTGDNGVRYQYEARNLELLPSYVAFKIGDRVKATTDVIGVIVNICGCAELASYEVAVVCSGLHFWFNPGQLRLWPEIKVGQRVLIVASPRPESKFAVGMYGTTLTGESGGVFEVRLDNGTRVICDRSMVWFLDSDSPWNPTPYPNERTSEAKRPLLDETLVLYSYASEGVHGGTAYDVKLRGIGGVELKLRLASMDGWDSFNQQQRFRITVTPIEEALEPTPLPCPFCQSSPVDDEQTLMCMACRRAATYEPTKEARVTAWNRRVK
jgi:hypothetical protein